jgi:hypothetical protein
MADGTSGRLDLVLVGAGSDGKDLGIDVSVVSPMAAAHVNAGNTTNSSSHTRLYAAKSMEDHKIAKYRAACLRHGLHFMPFVLETEGAMGNCAMKVFKILNSRMLARSGFEGHAWNSRSFKSVFMQGISSGLQQACAGGKRLSSGRSGDFWESFETEEDE